MKEGLSMAKVGRKILFNGCDYDCFNCKYPDCYCPDVLTNEEYSLEKQRMHLKKIRERAELNYERRCNKR